MQLACIQYVVTNGAQGMSNANKLFYKAFELYQNDPKRYGSILEEFYRNTLAVENHVAIDAGKIKSIKQGSFARNSSRIVD